MEKIKLLTNPRLMSLIKTQKDLIIVSDLDYTLTDFSTGHIEAINWLENQYPGLGKYTNSVFNLITDYWRGKDDDATKDCLFQIKNLQTNVLKKLGVKYWSRESWLILVSRKLSLNLRVAEIKQLSEKYWLICSKKAKTYEDAAFFLKAINKYGHKLIIMTGSDHILNVNKDFELSYDPKISFRSKLERLKNTQIRFDGVIIGDPDNKPDASFFNKVEKEIKRFGDNQEKVIFIGDSYINDLYEPEKRGYKCFLIKR